MKTFVCIDDTDNLETRGTGALAALMIEKIQIIGLGKCSDITRHQLYFHPDIPYTSHNSAMCFTIEHTGEIRDELRRFAEKFLEAESAEGSDPGLCIAELEKIQDREVLIEYGRRAKKEILTKSLAYEIAEALGIHLSEHGGTGGGVIGALAGVSLRLGGNDGRFKGKMKFPLQGDILTAREILDNSNIDRVQSLEGEFIAQNEKILLGEKVKAVLLDHKKVLLVYRKPEEETGNFIWHTCIKEQLRRF